MANCQRCKKTFRDNYALTSHMSRITKCIDPNNPIIKQNEQLEKQNEQLEKQKETSKKCCYCMNSFYNKGTMKRHLLTCRQKEDPIRLMEIGQSIKLVLPDCKTECRFCNKNFCKSTLLNKHLLVCKKREEYLDNLQKQQTIINNNINNNTTNNVHNGDNKLILNFGQENLNHIQIENIIQLLRGIRKEFGDDKVYLMAGDLITSFDNYVRDVFRIKLKLLLLKLF